MENWNELEQRYTVSESLFSSYFLAHKVEIVRNHMTVKARNEVNFAGDYRQNCIEWTHFMVKREVDRGVKDYHKSASISEAITRLKDRAIRMQKHVIEAIYYKSDVYSLSTYYPCNVPYNIWMNRQPGERKEVSDIVLTRLPVKPANTPSSNFHITDVSVDNQSEKSTVSSNNQITDSVSVDIQSERSAVSSNNRITDSVSVDNQSSVPNNIPVTMQSFVQTLKNEVAYDNE